MHGPFSIAADEHNRSEVKRAVDESLPSELRYAEFPRSVLHDFLTDLFITRPFGNHRNVAVHFTIYFYALYYFLLICFQPTVEVMQGNARHHTGGAVVEL